MKNNKKFLKGFIGELYSGYVNYLYNHYQSQDPDMGARFIAAIDREEKAIVNSKGKLITKEQRLLEDCQPKLTQSKYSFTSPQYIEICGLIFNFVQKTAVKFEMENALMGSFNPKIFNKEDRHENEHGN